MPRYVMNSAAGFDIYGSSILQFNLINSSNNLSLNLTLRVIMLTGVG